MPSPKPAAAIPLSSERRLGRRPVRGIRRRARGVPGGTGPQTAQALRNIEQILRACGATLADLVKVNVYLADMDTYAEMNAAYLAVIGDDPPARITVGRAALALGAAVEIDAVAYVAPA